MTIYDNNGDVHEDNNEDDNDVDDNTTTMATTMTMLMKMVVAIQWEKRQERAIQVADSLTDSQLCAQRRERGAFPVKWVVQTDKSGGVCSDSQRI